ncbi:double-strand-break repair protein rad21-like protein 1 isoform X2 [Anolis carolinensis]|uniref:double-strand-break repair protein rad21-like protein 1 isoform X2 n=1 Tax=Anolis carolinensis TaxID=28377 RepID=UPI002F2B9110
MVEERTAQQVREHNIGKMFYMQLLMDKRGPLAKIWLAAHWDKKVTKAHIFECNLETTIEKILSPKCAIALRTSGHLLLGVVRIYHRKTKYLLADCNEALLKMQATFRPGLVDLPKENCEANYDAITLPEEFHDFETQLPEVNAIDVAQHFTLNQSRVEDITLMEEDFRLPHSGSFGEEIEIPRQSSFLNDSLLTGSGGFLLDRSFLSFSGDKIALNEEESILKHDGFGDEGAVEDMINSVLGGEQHSLIELFGPEEEIPLISTPPTDDIADHPIPVQEAISPQVNETTLFSNEEEGFVLEPIDETDLKRKQRSKRKRKLLVDAMKGLSSTTIKNQLMNYKDTVTTLDIAPPTRKLMILQERGGVNKLLERSTQPLIHEHLLMLFGRSLRNGRKTLQQEAEIEERSKEQSIRESAAEVSNNLQDLVHQEIQPVLENGIDERNNAIHFETTEIMSALSSGSFMDSSVRQQTEMKQTALKDESQESNTENEEKKRQKRTLLLLENLRHIDQTGAKSFSLLALCKDNNSKEVASKFYSLLDLKKHQAVNVAQSAPYADIIVTKGTMFHTL